MKGRIRRTFLQNGSCHVLIDLFAIPLVLATSQNQCFFDAAPIVAREGPTANRSLPEKPLVIELTENGPTIDGTLADGTTLEDRFRQLDPASQIIVRATCNTHGQGPLGHLMQISIVAQQANVASRLFVVTREPTDSEK